MRRNPATARLRRRSICMARPRDKRRTRPNNPATAQHRIRPSNLATARPRIHRNSLVTIQRHIRRNQTRRENVVALGAG